MPEVSATVRPDVDEERVRGFESRPRLARSSISQEENVIVKFLRSEVGAMLIGCSVAAIVVFIIGPALGWW